MGWVWRDEPDEDFNSQSGGGEINPRSDGDRCSTRKVVRSQCKTEEVEPGKFVRKCEKTEEVLRECFGKPVEVLKSNKEYTEDDVTGQVVKGSFPSGKFDDGPFDFPGIRSDIEAIERQFFGGINRFFGAAEEMTNSFLDIFGSPHLYDGESSSPPSTRRGIPIEGPPRMEAPPKPKEHDSGLDDLSGLARDV